MVLLDIHVITNQLTERRTFLAVATSRVDRAVTVIVAEQWMTLATVQTRILLLAHVVSCNHRTLLL